MRRHIHSFSSGLAFSGLMFVSLHRIELLTWDRSNGVALAVFALLLGCLCGIKLSTQPPRQKPSRTRIISCLMLLSWLMLSLFHYLDPRLGLPLIIVATALSSSLLLSPAIRTAGATTTLLAGLIVGCSLLAAGAATVLSIQWVLPVLGTPAAIYLLASPEFSRYPRPNSHARRDGDFAGFTFYIAIGILAVIMLRTYSHATGWSAYAMAHIMPAFATGMLTHRLFAGDIGDNWWWRGTSAAAITALSLIMAGTFFLYPDLIMSEAAVLDSPQRLLTYGRIFPFWFLAAAAGFFAPANSQTETGGYFHPLAGAVLGSALLAFLPGNLPWRWGYVIAIASLGITFGMDALYARKRCLGKRETAILICGAAFLACSLGWIAIGDLSISHLGLRRSFADYCEIRPYRLNAPAEPTDVTVKTDNIWTGDSQTEMGYAGRFSVSDGYVVGEFSNGNLISTSRQLEDTSPAILPVLLYSMVNELDRVAVLQPSLDMLIEGTRKLIPEALVMEKPASILASDQPMSDKFDGIILGPGPVAASRNSLSLFSKERLKNIGSRLSRGGRCAIWLSTRNIDPQKLRRVMATVASVFSGVELFQYRDDIILVCAKNKLAGEKRFDFARLREVLARDESLACLRKMGIWNPAQVTATWSGGTKAVRQISRNAEVYSWDRPIIPPILARDLASPTRPDTLLMVVMGREDAFSNLPRFIDFGNENVEKVHKGTVMRLHTVQTTQIMAQIGEVAMESEMPSLRTEQLNNVLQDQLDSGSNAGSRKIRLAKVLHKLTLTNNALKMLASIPAADKGFDAYELEGRILAEEERYELSAEAYRNALDKRDSSEVRLRLAEVLLKNDEESLAKVELEEVIKKTPEKVEALVHLSAIEGRAKNYDRAAELARRALEQDPSNTRARNLMFLFTRWE
jgi:thioredoxin-like negative regulator of GroEL